MKTFVIAVIALCCPALHASAQEPNRDALDRVQRRLAEAALLVRADAGAKSCRERVATVVVNVEKSGYLKEYRVGASTGRTNLDAQLPEVLSLAAPFPELAGGEVAVEVKFACLTN